MSPLPPPKRPPAKPPNIPPVTETSGRRSYPIDPYAPITKSRPVDQLHRPVQPSGADIEVARLNEQQKAFEWRLEAVEEIVPQLDKKLDDLTDIVKKDMHDRALKEASKSEDKLLEDQKTKRYQALLAAIPLILAPILGFYASYMNKETPSKHETTTVIVSEYTQAVEDCKKNNKSEQSFVECVRNEQLKNTPVFRK